MPLPSTVNEPYWPLPPSLTVQVWVSLVSTSCWVSWPDTVSLVSSSRISPTVVPLMVGASLVPVTVTVMTWVALPPWPSSTVTVMVSVTFWPSASAWTLSLLLSSTYVHLPFWSTVRVPYWPLPPSLTDQVWVSLVSTSCLANWPETSCAPSSLTSPAASPLMVGASLVPLMVMVTVPVVPSAVVTVKVSVSFSPTASACTRGSAWFRL